MRSIFLSPEQVFGGRLTVLEPVGASAPPSDLAILNCLDDGFLLDGMSGINYYLSGDGAVDRFGRSNKCDQCAVRPVIQLEAGERKLLRRIQKSGMLTVAELGTYPTAILDASLREMAESGYKHGGLRDTGKTVHVCGEETPVYTLGAKQIVCVRLENGGINGYAQLSDGSVVVEKEQVFLELKSVRWIYDETNSLLISCLALFGGLSREEAAEYLSGDFIKELTADYEKRDGEKKPYKVSEHSELELIAAYVNADIPVFIHGPSGDGKSDRVRQIDPQALDIELVNENPETINGRAVYNETKNEIVDIKPVWLIKLEKLCEDGENHILFFDELTNATKQTQSVIFKIVLERFVNNRWPLPKNARIVAAGNERSESSAAHDLAEPLFGRFAHIYINTTIENWMPWAVEHRLNPYVMEFLANNNMYLHTGYTGTEGYADPRRWEMASKALDSSGNDFALLSPIVGLNTAEAFIRFFKAQEQLTEIGNFTDADIARFSVARKYQIAQQCLYLAPAKPEEARELVRRLGAEYSAWFEYMLERKKEII